MSFRELNVNAQLNDNDGDVQPRHVQAHCHCRSAQRDHAAQCLKRLGQLCAGHAAWSC